VKWLDVSQYEDPWLGLWNIVLNLPFMKGKFFLNSWEPLDS